MIFQGKIIEDVNFIFNKNYPDPIRPDDPSQLRESTIP